MLYTFCFHVFKFLILQETNKPQTLSICYTSVLNDDLTLYIHKQMKVKRIVLYTIQLYHYNFRIFWYYVYTSVFTPSKTKENTIKLVH